ncbi:MAG: flagellar hook-associated protein FlgK [bacterium]
MPNTFETALSGLRTAQRGLATVSHNIANASTDGYTRQRIEQGTRAPQLEGNFWLGTGVDVNATTRIRDEFIDARLQTMSSEHSRLEAFHSMASRIDTMFSSDALSLTPVMQEFFNSIENLNSDPSSQSARQVTINNAENLVARLHTLDSQLNDLGEEVNRRVTRDIGDINRFAEGIALINKEIASAYGQSQGGAPNDLLDQRDELVRQLSERIQVQTLEQNEGQINVFVGNGINLVVGSTQQEITATPSPFDPAQLEVGIRTQNNEVKSINNLIIGGSLGGAMDFRREMLHGITSELGRVATVFGAEINAQHAKGVDLYDEAGLDIFSLQRPTVIEQDSNTGNANIAAQISDTKALTTSDYRLTFDGTNHVITRLSDNAQVTGIPATMDGVDFSITGGAMAAGDSFLIRPTIDAARTIEVNITDTNRLAVGAPVRGDISAQNTGGALLEQPQVLDAANPALKDPVTITFKTDPANPNARLYDLTNATSGAVIAADQPYVGGGDIAANGWATQVEGLPNAGDSFTVSGSINGVSDNRNGLALANLQNNASIGGQNTYQEGYSTLVGKVGSLTRQTQIAGSAQEKLLEQTQLKRDSVSAVNLDEEAVNLTRYQKAYQASAQVIQTSNGLFDSILAIFR